MKLKRNKKELLGNAALTEKRIAVFAGSFDPFTSGHLDLVTRGARLFDELWVLVAVNTSKKTMFSMQNRVEYVEKACDGLENVKVAEFDGLTVDFMKSVNAKFLLRGVRNGTDMDYELPIHWNNQLLYPECETVFLPSSKEHLNVSSSVVRELLKCGLAANADGRKMLKNFVPASILNDVIKDFKNG